MAQDSKCFYGQCYLGRLDLWPGKQHSLRKDRCQVQVWSVHHRAGEKPPLHSVLLVSDCRSPFMEKGKVLKLIPPLPHSH